MLESNTDGKGLARKVTAMGTVGEANQLFTVYEKNWHCPGLKKPIFFIRMINTV